MKLAFGTMQQDNDTSALPQPKPRFLRRWLRLLVLKGRETQRWFSPALPAAVS